MTIDSLPPAIPAATLIVLRAAVDGPPEILMVERSAAMAFAPGSLVFPGGRVEAFDRDPQWPGDAEDGAARIAAIRETIEEAGVAIAVDPVADGATIDRWREGLAAGRALIELTEDDGVRLDPGDLQPYTRWRPSHRVARIYDTRFYLARWPDGAPPPRVDASETVRAFWSSAGATLAAVAAGRAHAIFPTVRTLERLAQFAAIDAIFADARALPPTTIVPWIEVRDGVDHLCIPDGLGYPVTAAPMAGASRG